MGLISVGAALQGQGIGRRMMATLLERLDGRSIALHATRAGLPLYQRTGFEATGTTVQHQGPAGHAPLMQLPDGTRLRPAGIADLAALASLDRDAGGMDRVALLETLLAAPGSVVLDGEDGPVGFALVRAFGRGQLIGPVVARDLAAAQAMVSHLLGQRMREFVRLDVPKESGLGPWLSSLGLEEAGTVIRMVRGADAPPGRMRVFGLASQAWG